MDQAELQNKVKSLMKAVSDEIPELALNLLDVLAKDAAPTEEMLRATKAGIMVNRLRANENKKIGRAATELVMKWKKVVEQEKASRFYKTKKGVSVGLSCKTDGYGSPADGNAESETVASSHYSRLGEQAFVGDPEKRTFKSDGVDLTRTKSTLRDNAIGLLYNGLAYRSTESIDKVLARAVHVEDAAFRHFNGETQQYKDKMRSLMLNLKSKSNRELGRSVMSGDLSAARFLTMTAEEMRSEEQRSKDAAMERENMKKAQVAEPMMPETDGRQCFKCKKRKVTLEQKQTRSADEPMTCIWTCLLCGNRWRAE